MPAREDRAGFPHTITEPGHAEVPHESRKRQTRFVDQFLEIEEIPGRGRPRL
jgi:hypothetical protein